MFTPLRKKLPVREVAICTLEERNKFPAKLKESGKLIGNWTLVIVNPKELERAVATIQGIADNKRITNFYISKSVDIELIEDVVKLCAVNRIGCQTLDADNQK